MEPNLDQGVDAPQSARSGSPPGGPLDAESVAYAGSLRAVTTVGAPAARDGSHDTDPHFDGGPHGHGAPTQPGGDGAADWMADTRRLGLARLLLEPEVEETISAFVASAPPLPEDVRSRLARLLRTDDCYDAADQHPDPPAAGGTP